jgi:hypothetical protein
MEDSSTNTTNNISNTVHNSRCRRISRRVLLLLPWGGCVMIVLWGGCHWQNHVLHVNALDLVVVVVVVQTTQTIANIIVVVGMEEEEEE